MPDLNFSASACGQFVHEVGEMEGPVFMIFDVDFGVVQQGFTSVHSAGYLVTGYLVQTFRSAQCRLA